MGTLKNENPINPINPINHGSDNLRYYQSTRRRIESGDKEGDEQNLIFNYQYKWHVQKVFKYYFLN